MSERDRTELVADLHEHLAATQELPVEREASRWIGEAEAVAGDLVGAAVEPAVIEERVGHVAGLLDHVEATGDPAADEHVVAAKALAAQLLEDEEG